MTKLLKNTKRTAKKAMVTAALAMCLISSTSSLAYAASVGYKAHCAGIGWQQEKTDGATAGTTGQSRQAECWTARLIGVKGNIVYRSHVQNRGTMEWRRNNEPSGTTAEGLRLEAIEAKLEGEAANQYYLEYRTHVQDIGWTKWVRSGWSGTIGQSKRVEAIEMRLVPKNGGGGGASVVVSNLNWSAAQSKYPNGSTWNSTYKNKASQCHGWACSVADYITGTDPYTWTKKTSLNNLKPGDIIRFNRPHSIIVTGVNGNTITYADCNWVGKNKVSWGQTINKNSLTSKFGSLNYVMSCPK